VFVRATLFSATRLHASRRISILPDWNRKEYLKAKIRTALKTVLMKAIDGRAEYPEIEKLSVEVLDHAETVYVLQHDERLLTPMPMVDFGHNSI
jgi:hypothetical protein